MKTDMKIKTLLSQFIVALLIPLALRAEEGGFFDLRL